jgi:hypothetical protein
MSQGAPFPEGRVSSMAACAECSTDRQQRTRSRNQRWMIAIRLVTSPSQQLRQVQTACSQPTASSPRLSRRRFLFGISVERSEHAVALDNIRDNRGSCRVWRPVLNALQTAAADAFSKPAPDDRYPACDQPEPAASSGPDGLLTTHRLEPTPPSETIFFRDLRRELSTRRRARQHL